MERREAWIVVRQARLATGLVLFAYVATHLLNHALGTVSLAAAEAGRFYFLALWRNPVGTGLLYGSLATHLLLALWSLYRRRSLKMPGWEAGQLLLGLAIPPLLVEHAIGTRFLEAIANLDDSYTYIALVLWIAAPEKGVQQIATLTLAWLHGCIGLHFWLRLKPGYRRAAPLLYAAALLLPALALFGFASLGREVEVLARDPAWLAEARAYINFPGPEAIAVARALNDGLINGFVALLAATLLARAVRQAIERRRGLARITYPGGRTVAVQIGTTVLEASRSAGIAHASVCGGRGRCSTCRIRVGFGLDRQPPPGEEEQRVLKRIGAAPNVRLACQLRPTADLTVAPLLPPGAGPRAARPRAAHLSGEEKEIAILFADLRDFTRLAEGRLPYDVVFVLNRYFESMGHAIEESGGTVDKFIGDGVMALFGVERGAAEGCRGALAAARAMTARLAELNRTLEHELGAPLRIGIGIHAGPAIVGEMGYARATSVTAVGDAVNAASRLESMTKEFGVELVVSEAVARHAGVSLDAFPAREVAVRGRREPMRVRVVADASTLPDMASGR